MWCKRCFYGSQTLTVKLENSHDENSHYSLVGCPQCGSRLWEKTNPAPATALFSGSGERNGKTMAKKSTKHTRNTAQVQLGLDLDRPTGSALSAALG
jgi:hypothetical protein